MLNHVSSMPDFHGHCHCNVTTFFFLIIICDKGIPSHPLEKEKQ